MGFFSKAPVVCAICGRDCATAGGKKQLKDAIVCWSCLTRAGYSPKDAPRLSLMDLQPKAAAVNRTLQSTEAMPVGLQLQDFCIDTVGKQWYCKGGLFTGTGDRCPETAGVHALNDLRITWVESYTLNTVTAKTSNNGIKRAIIGGVLAGSTGAVIGAVTAKQTTTSEAHSAERFHVHFQFKNEAKDYWIYLQDTNEVNLLLQCVAQVQREERPQVSSPVDELRKYKELLDDGIITQQDFDAKKKQLLGL